MKTKYLLQFMLLVLAFTSCEKEELSDKKEITSFVFKAEDNPTLEHDIKSEIKDNEILAIVPVEIHIGSLIPTITYEGSSIEPKTKESQDYSRNIRYSVTSENSEVLKYEVKILKECTIVFDSNGGSPIDAIKTIVNTIVKKPNAPLLKHHVLAGWETKDGEIFSFNIPITTNLTLKAKWRFSNISDDGNWRVEYSETTGDAYIVDFLGDETVEEIIVPATINNRKVAMIYGFYPGLQAEGRNIFNSENNYGSSIKKLDLSNAIYLKYIIHNAFSNLKNLEILILPPKLEDIGYGAFKNCSKLSNVDFPDKLLKIGQRAFSNCNFDIVKFPNSINSIGSWAFYGNKISNLNLYNTQVSLILSGAFSDCSLNSVSLPKTLEYVGDYVFQNNPNLTYIQINRDNLPLTKITSSTFIDTPIENGSQSATIYYPKETDYPNMDGWKDLNVIWTLRLN